MINSDKKLMTGNDAFSTRKTNNGKHLFYTAFYQSIILTHNINKEIIILYSETENEVETIVETLRLRRMPMHLCNTASDDSDEKCELQKGSKKV